LEGCKSANLTVNPSAPDAARTQPDDLWPLRLDEQLADAGQRDLKLLGAATPKEAYASSEQMLTPARA